MKKALVFVSLLLVLTPPVYSFQFSKAVGGALNDSRSFSLRVDVPPDYSAAWLVLTFASNKTCNALASYSVVQYHETVRNGNVSVMWTSADGGVYEGSFVIPLNGLRDEFDVYANISFPCRVKPLDYTLYFSVDLDRLGHLVVRTNRSVESSWVLDIVKSPRTVIHLNTSERLLGVRLRLYNYNGKLVYGIMNWSGGSRNFTVPVRRGWLWIPGWNATGRADMMLDVPPNTGIEARAYYFSERKPVNEDLLYKKGSIIHFILPLKGIVWDEGRVNVWFSGKGKILTFDFVTAKGSRVYVEGNKACAELYIPGRWMRKKSCVEIPESRVHGLHLMLSRSPDGRRYMDIQIDGVDIFKDFEVDSGMRLWYLGDSGENFNLISFDANLKRNPNYYVIPPDERKAELALFISTAALIVSIVLNLRRLRR